MGAFCRSVSAENILGKGQNFPIFISCRYLVELGPRQLGLLVADVICAVSFFLGGGFWLSCCLLPWTIPVRSPQGTLTNIRNVIWLHNWMSPNQMSNLALGELLHTQRPEITTQELWKQFFCLGSEKVFPKICLPRNVAIISEFLGGPS